MRTRLTVLIAAGFLVIGSGGAFALTGGVGGSGHRQSASTSQYCEKGKTGKGNNKQCPGEKGKH